MAVRIVDKCQIDDDHGSCEIRIIKSEHVGKKSTHLSYVVHLIEGDKITILARDLSSLQTARDHSDKTYGTRFREKHLAASDVAKETAPRSSYQQFTGTSRTAGKK